MTATHDLPRTKVEPVRVVGRNDGREVRDVTLSFAKRWLTARLDKGSKCPCCGQYAKVYKRTIHSRMAADLIVALRRAGTEWFHLPTMGNSYGGDFAKLVHWGLIEESPEVRADGSPRAGWWRITEKGEAYVRGRQKVHKYARIYNGKCLGLTDELVSIKQALRNRFDYDELMDN